MLRIYHSPLSTPANKVLMCANVLGIDYEPVAVDLRQKEQKSRAFLEINPFGKVPAIDDDGYYLFESNAIMKYLCRKHASELYPGDLHAQAFVDEWCDFSISLLAPAIGRVVFNRLLAPLSGMPVSAESLADGLKFIANYLPVMEQRLETSKYFAGHKMTLADISILATLDPAEACAIELSSFSALYTWREALRAEDFYTSVHRFYGEGILPSS